MTALNGGLADCAISPSGDIDATHVHGFQALARLIKATGSAVELAAAGDAGSGKPGLTAELPGPCRTTVLDIRRFRSFSPAIRSGFRNLDLVIINDRPADAARPARLVPHEPSEAALIEADTVDLACRYARRFERGSVQVVVGVDDDIHGCQSLRQLLASCAERWPGANIELLTAPEAVAALMAGQSRLDVVATTRPIARILAEIAGPLSGARPLETNATLRGNLMTVWAPDDAVQESAKADFPMSAYVLATAELLVWLGQTEAVHRLLNGWCRALELGMHSAEIRVTHPYARELDDDELADAVIELLGELPQALSPHCPAPRADSSLKRFAANLRLVR